VLVLSQVLDALPTLRRKQRQVPPPIRKRRKPSRSHQVLQRRVWMPIRGSGQLPTRQARRVNRPKARWGGGGGIVRGRRRGMVMHRLISRRRAPYLSRKSRGPILAWVQSLPEREPRKHRGLNPTVSQKPEDIAPGKYPAPSPDFSCERKPPRALNSVENCAKTVFTRSQRGISSTFQRSALFFFIAAKPGKLPATGE
jgi:hypothetical protein